ncbi:unnamed protein product [Cyprideis torosa]|uniref:Uncharacterized protein n=1 Tax=Cyprideis torosa TaxID=163714 RepID=A0A7R8W941_9CRUS|nr:unnamed protein product [Cyprideis torosa]CAG0889345.1 unnamed protein product [Cyprideis torosa]
MRGRDTTDLAPEKRGEVVDYRFLAPEEIVCISLEYYEPYLRCPAALTVAHLKKFIRMKFELIPENPVDIIYREECLPSEYSLMDVAFIYSWKKREPMRLFYRIMRRMWTGKRIRLFVRKAAEIEAPKKECQNSRSNEAPPSTEKEASSTQNEKTVLPREKSGKRVERSTTESISGKHSSGSVNQKREASPKESSQPPAKCARIEPSSGATAVKSKPKESKDKPAINSAVNSHTNSAKTPTTLPDKCNGKIVPKSVPVTTTSSSSVKVSLPKSSNTKTSALSVTTSPSDRSPSPVSKKPPKSPKKGTGTQTIVSIVQTSSNRFIQLPSRSSEDKQATHFTEKVLQPNKIRVPAVPLPSPPSSGPSSTHSVASQTESLGKPFGSLLTAMRPSLTMKSNAPVTTATSNTSSTMSKPPAASPAVKVPANASLKVPPPAPVQSSSAKVPLPASIPKTLATSTSTVASSTATKASSVTSNKSSSTTTTTTSSKAKIPTTPQQAPSPAPSSRKVPSPAPSSRQVPSPAPSSRQVSSPAPSSRQVPSPAPSSRQVPSPAPSSRQAPSPAPSSRHASSPGPDPRHASSPAPSPRHPTPPKAKGPPPDLIPISEFNRQRSPSSPSVSHRSSTSTPPSPSQRSTPDKNTGGGKRPNNGMVMSSGPQQMGPGSYHPFRPTPPQPIPPSLTPYSFFPSMLPQHSPHLNGPPPPQSYPGRGRPSLNKQKQRTPPPQPFPMGLPPMGPPTSLPMPSNGLSTPRSSASCSRTSPTPSLANLHQYKSPLHNRIHELIKQQQIRQLANRERARASQESRTIPNPSLVRNQSEIRLTPPTGNGGQPGLSMFNGHGLPPGLASAAAAAQLRQSLVAAYERELSKVS